MNIDTPKAYTISDVDSMPAEMTTLLQLSPLRLVPVGTKAVDLDFDGGRLSSDAGLVLLRDPDAPLGHCQLNGSSLDSLILFLTIFKKNASHFGHLPRLCCSCN
jgi:hypothetical protein